MAGKKPSLASFKPTARSPLVMVNPEPESEAVSTTTEAESRAKKSRKNVETVPVVAKKKATFEIHPDAAHQLSVIKLETSKSKNDLVSEALNLLFKKYGKPIIK